MRRALAVPALAALLAGCGGRVVPPLPYGAPPADRPRVGAPALPIPPVPAAPAVPSATGAAQVGLVAGPPVANLPLTADGAARALVAFRASCPALVRRVDASGLTRGADWQPACAAAATASAGSDSAGFFATWFEAVQVADGRAFATGYYLPEIAGSLRRGGPYQTPIYARPDDLVDVDLGLFSADLKGKRIRGRIEGRNFVPYDDRAAIEGGALDGRARVLAWAADPIELFFLQVQGSGVLRLPDGTTLGIGYDSQNGRDYTAIGATMRQRGLVAPGQASMQGIVQWLHDHPTEGRALMRENKSFVFFRMLDGGAPGSLGVPVTGGATVAADPRFVPLGAPVFLSLDRADASGLWVAQDTGGAIKGANRFDTFWGAGAEARAIAGGMSAHGTAFVLVPVGTLIRWQANVAAARP